MSPLEDLKTLRGKGKEERNSLVKRARTDICSIWGLDEVEGWRTVVRLREFFIDRLGNVKQQHAIKKVWKNLELVTRDEHSEKTIAAVTKKPTGTRKIGWNLAISTESYLYKRTLFPLQVL